jgi:exodeoxyribonuclease-5
VKVFNKNEDQVFAEAALVSADTIICYRNSTRHALNLAMLKERGLVDKTDWETPLELLQALINKPFRCVGLRNNYKVQFFNGQIAELTITDILGDRMAYGNLNMDGVVRTVVLDTSSFLREGKGEERELPGSVQCDFGYALTCHKSQGSEWDNVCVYDDTWSDMKDHQRWCYTAATRAKKGLVWVTL